MIRIIGFEGVVGEALISYGAAAVELPDGMVMNSFTRLRQAAGGLNDQAEALTRFARPWELEDESLQEHPLVVVAVRRDGAPPYVEDLYPDTGRLGGYVRSKREKPFVYFILRDRDAFRLYADDMARQCADAIMREEWNGPDALGLLKCALTLTPRDPVLLALRVHLAPDRSIARRTADRLLEATPPEVQARFEQILRACEKSSAATTLYLVKYEDGDQRIGGMDLNTAVLQLEAFDGVHEKLEPALRREIPFLEDGEELPALRLQSLKAASAELGFGVLGKNMRERVIRFLELELLAQLFRGFVPPELARDQTFAQELRQILNPPGGATLSHQPIGADDLEPVVVELPNEDVTLIDEKQFRVLGFVQGFFREVKRAEIRISTVHMEPVAISDDGTGLSPIGAEILRSGQGLFLPAVFALLRRRLASGRTQWHMQRMTLLTKDAECSIDTLPSSIVPKGLFMPAVELPVSYDGAVLHVGHHRLRTQHATDIDSARTWLTAWHTDAHEGELSCAKDEGSAWFPSPAFEEGVLTPLARILLVLGAVEESATVDQIVQTIDYRFSVRVRRNNTWRAIREKAELFEVKDDQVGLTSLGRRWASVLQRFEHARRSAEGTQ